MDWFRWHHGTVSDPKFKLVATRAGQPVTTVLAVWAAMLERASQETPRGTLDGWDPESVAMGLDIQIDAVLAIHQAMQGRMLEGDDIRAWRKRQPRREDDSADRVRAFRAKPKGDAAVDVTQGNALKRNVTLEESRVDKKRKKKPSASKNERWRFCPDDFVPKEKHAVLAGQLGVDVATELVRFREHEFRDPKSDPDRAFSRWLRNVNNFAPSKLNGKPTDPWAIKPGELDQ